MSRIVICCDGTSASPDQETPTNVLITSRAVLPETQDGTRQVTFYDAGVGTGNFIDRWITGGALGKGLTKNIEDAFRFLMHNYMPEDEVFLFGFSRGAYTVRSLVGMLNNVGLLHKNESDKFYTALEMYRDRGVKPASEEAINFRKEYSREIRVKFLGVWDTVGSMGIPLRGLTKYWLRNYGFHDSKLSPLVDQAYQALAIDEKRRTFPANVWEREPAENQQVEQVWFSGVHSDVGGSYKEQGLSNITLRWMLAKAHAAGLRFDDTYLTTAADPKAPTKIHNSWTGAWKIIPRVNREMGVTNVATESIHQSVIDNQPRHRTKPASPAVNSYLDSGLLRISDNSGNVTFSQEYESRQTVKIPASVDGYVTGIQLETDATYELEANGIWNDDWIVCRPDGVPVNPNWRRRLRAKAFQRLIRTLARIVLRTRFRSRSGVAPLARFRLFALVGEMQQDFGANSGVFPIGFGPRQLKPPMTGVLVVRPNDYPGMYGNNSGEISLKVRKISKERTVKIA